MPRQSAQGVRRPDIVGRDRQPPAMARLKLTPQKREFFGLYNRSAENIVAIAELLVELLDRFPDGADDLERKVKDTEHVGNRILHDSVSSLFMARSDPLEVIRWKDIHESLEEAMNACEYAANVLEAIVVKNR